MASLILTTCIELSEKQRFKRPEEDLAHIVTNIAKGTTDPRVEFCLPKFKQVQAQISIKFHLQNLNQALTSKSQPNISISTKLKIQNIDQS